MLEARLELSGQNPHVWLHQHLPGALARRAVDHESTRGELAPGEPIVGGRSDLASLSAKEHNRSGIHARCILLESEQIGPRHDLPVERSPGSEEQVTLDDNL